LPRYQRRRWHTDDIARHHSFFDWNDLLADSVLAPVRDGRPCPTALRRGRTGGRPGAIDVPAGLDVVFVEGNGACRTELSHLVDAVVWVQSDGREAKRRALARDVEHGGAPEAVQAEAFWDEWMAEETPLLRQRPPVGPSVLHRRRHARAGLLPVSGGRRHSVSGGDHKRRWDRRDAGRTQVSIRVNSVQDRGFSHP
jgi:hypothetical protein